MNRPRIFLFSAVIFCISVSLYFAYSRYFSPVMAKGIILSEDQEEYKKKPVDPGGIVIPHSNSLIYEKLKPGRATAESRTNLQPDPESPMELEFKANSGALDTQNTDAIYDSIDDILAKLDLSGTEPGFAFGTPDLQGPELLPNDSVTSEDDQTGGGKKDDLKIIKVEGSDNRKLRKLGASSVDAGYKLHLSSSWSEKEAKEEWQKIQMRHLKYLGKMQGIIKKVKAKNDKIIYLVMAGSYPSLSQAKLVCKKLHLSKQNCIVTK